MGCEAVAIHEAYKHGDLEALTALLGGQEIKLEYAIYHSPLPFVRTLLELGADPNYDGHAGFPSLIAAISTERPDKYNLVELLLTSGADIHQRGMNDYTPLHYAAARNDAKLIELLLARGADPTAKTRIDEYATPAEEAELLRCSEAAQALRKASEPS
jgi:ankyrin repeat protein